MTRSTLNVYFHLEAPRAKLIVCEERTGRSLLTQA